MKTRFAGTAAMVAAVWLGAAQAAPSSVPSSQRSFASVEEAVTAFVAALRDNRRNDLHAILGPEADRYADAEIFRRFVTLYDQKHVIRNMEPDRAELQVGPDDWPLPIPLAASHGRWTFDTRAGAQTVIDRRIGRNELSAIRTLLACVDAQHEYFARAKQTNGAGVYASRILSTPGQHDGLYWPTAGDDPESPLGPLVDAARDAGYPGAVAGGKPIPYEGYYFHVLKAQGPNGDGGAKSYVTSGRMVGGFALVAWPATYRSSGVMTFIVGPAGDIYQKDIGSETARTAAKIATFDPDETWTRVVITND